MTVVHKLSGNEFPHIACDREIDHTVFKFYDRRHRMPKNDVLKHRHWRFVNCVACREWGADTGKLASSWVPTTSVAQQA